MPTSMRPILSRSCRPTGRMPERHAHVAIGTGVAPAARRPEAHLAVSVVPLDVQRTSREEPERAAMRGPRACLSVGVMLWLFMPGIGSFAEEAASSSGGETRTLASLGIKGEILFK